jgi:uncharacterized iron-regulated membrane protein
MRPALVLLHRWFGLVAAAFLFVAGATGAVIAWEDELDAALNPTWFEARTPGTPLPPLELARRIEAADPRAQVSYLPLSHEPGKTFPVFVEPRTDPATGRPFDLGYDQVFADPVTGTVLGRREFGAASLDRTQLIPFLHELHDSLQLPDVGGYAIGTLFMGGLAMAWIVDTLVALWLSFPNLTTWRRSFAFRWTAGRHKLTFDLHRSGGTWLFALVLTIAVTSVAMNLGPQVMRPVVALFSPLTPTAFEGRDATNHQTTPITLQQAITIAQREATRRGWQPAPGGAMIRPTNALYGIGFFMAGHVHGDPGLGNPWIYIDATDGHLVTVDEPGQGTAGDVFLQAMFPLHSGRIAGLPGRILVTLIGVAVAAFSVTGVLIWARKRRARRSAHTASATVNRDRTVRSVRTAQGH